MKNLLLGVLLLVSCNLFGQSDQTITGNISSSGTGSAICMPTTALTGVGVVLTGTWNGTISATLKMADGSTFKPTQFRDSSGNINSTITSNDAQSILITGGISHACVYFSVYTSGTVSVALRATMANTPYTAIPPISVPTPVSVLPGDKITGSEWRISNTPAGANTIATATQAAGGAGVRHVLDCINFSATATASLGATASDVVVRDGTSGAGAILYTFRHVLVGVGNLGQQVSPCGLNIVGSSNTAMTIEWTTTTLLLFQSVNGTGFDIQ